MLELIRYIHLNPLRAGLVNDLKELDRYPWTGHSAILGRRKNPLISEVRNLKSEVRSQSTTNQPERPKGPGEPSKPNRRNTPDRPDRPEKALAEKTVEDVLLHFGNSLKVARRRYWEFVEKAIDQGTRPELQGGGLVRSAGGDKRGLLGRKKGESEKGDERILGSGDFVERVLSELNQVRKNGTDRKISLFDLIDRISVFLGIEKEELLSGSRKQGISHARDLISFLAVKNMGYKYSDIANSLNVHPVSAARCAERGKKLIDNYNGIWDLVR